MALFAPKTLALGLAGAATLALGGCYDGYGYSGASIGVGSGYYGNGYADPFYDGYGGYDYPSYGWFDGFYYPGNGYYIYDRGGRRFSMRDRDRQHWYGNRRDGQGGVRGDGRGGNWQRRGDGRPGDGRPGDGRPGDGGAGAGWSGDRGPGVVRPDGDRARFGMSRRGDNGQVREQGSRGPLQSWGNRQLRAQQGQEAGVAPQRERSWTPRTPRGEGGGDRQRTRQPR
ncbi:MAG: peptidase [Sphingomonas bacterium]|nr:peptidase [Sphingomonas bacterium]